MKKILSLIITILSCASSDCPPAENIPHQDFPRSAILDYQYSTCSVLKSEKGVKRLNLEYQFDPETGNVIRQTEFSEDTSLGKQVEILYKYETVSPFELLQIATLVYHKLTTRKRDTNYDIIEESEEIVCDTAMLEYFTKREHKVYNYKNGLLEKYTVYQFNQCNQEIGGIEYSADAAIRRTFSSEIDSKGRIFQIIKMDSDSNVFSRIKFNYDENSNMTTQTTYNLSGDSSEITFSNYTGVFYNKMHSSKQANAPEFEIIIFRNDHNLVTKKILQVKRENMEILSDTFYFEYSK